jgi:hypothetical protein
MAFGSITCQQKCEIDAGAGYRPIRGLLRWSVSERAGELARSFNIEASEKDAAAIAKVRISAGYGTGANDFIELVREASVQSRSEGWQADGYHTSLAGVDGADKLVQVSPEKTLVFLSQEHIQKHAKGYEWRLNPDTQMIEGHFAWNGKEYSWPLRIPEIPGDKNLAGTFETHVIESSRDEILEVIAGKLGIAIRNGTPTMPFRGAYTLNDSRTYFEAVRDQAAVWNPLITILREGSEWALYILDVEDGQTMPGGYTVQQQLLTVTGIQQTREEIVNRAAIIGADQSDAPAACSLFAPPRNREPLDLSADYVVERWMETDPTTGKPLAGCDTYGDHTLTRVVKEYARDPADQYNRVVIREEISVYGSLEDGEHLVSKKITTYHYLTYTAAIGQDTEEWHRLLLPGEVVPRLVKVKETKTAYGDYIEEAGEIERIETEGGAVVYDLVEIDDPDHPGQKIKKRLNPEEHLAAHNDQIIDTRSVSMQSYQWVTIRRRQTRYEIEDSQRVRRDTIIFNCLKGTAELETEYIPISYENRRGRGTPGQQDRWEYEDAESIAAYGYRPRVEISVPDLKKGIDDPLADELWARIKRKSGASRIEASVGIPAWLPVLLGEKITVQEVTLKEWAPGGAFADRVIPGGDYYVTGSQHQFETSRDAKEAKFVTSLSLRSKF